MSVLSGPTDSMLLVQSPNPKLLNNYKTFGPFDFAIYIKEDVVGSGTETTDRVHGMQPIL